MRRNFSTIYIIAAVALILIFGLFGGLPLAVRWLLVMGTFVGLLALVGREITGAEQEIPLRSGRTELRFTPGRFDGVLIDSRNKISLSRLQLVLWTVVVLSAWTTLALHRVIPVIQGRLLASNAQLVQEVAGLLAGENEAGEADTSRAAAMLEQITGAEVSLTDSGEEQAVLYSPLAIGFPTEVLLALGISITSLAGAGLIKTNQATNEEGRALEVASVRTEKAHRRAAGMDSQIAALESEKSYMLEAMSGGLESADGSPATAEELAAAQARLSSLTAELQAAQAAADRANKRAADLEAARDTSVGELHARPTSADARWSDMLRGDTVANFQFTDLGKIQMFLFTVILVFAYAALIWSIMSMPQASRVLQLVPSMSLPTFSDSLVITMALSHGGYLATKTTV